MSIKTELLHTVNGRNPPCLAEQPSTKPEWIRAMVTFKSTLTACTWLRTFTKLWDWHRVRTAINHRKPTACFIEALLNFNHIYFEEGTGLVIPWAGNPSPGPHTPAPPNQPHRTVLQNVREFNTNIPVSTGTAEGTALLVFTLGSFWRSNSFKPIKISYILDRVNLDCVCTNIHQTFPFLNQNAWLCLAPQAVSCKAPVPAGLNSSLQENHINPTTLPHQQLLKH